MKIEGVTPADCEAFRNDPNAMKRYEKCFDSCLSHNFNGAITPVVQDIIADAQAGERNCIHGNQCDTCPLIGREMNIATLLLLDALL